MGWYHALQLLNGEIPRAEARAELVGRSTPAREAKAAKVPVYMGFIVNVPLWLCPRGRQVGRRRRSGRPAVGRVATDTTRPRA